MEIPYRSSTAESEERRSSIIVPAISPQIPADTKTLSVPLSTTKGTSVGSVVSNLLARNRKSSSGPYNYEEMNWTLRRQASNVIQASEEVLLNNNNINKDPNDYRVTVV